MPFSQIRYILLAPVSYTHLDVYKRQVLWFLLHVGAALLGGHVSAWWLLFVPTTFYLLYGVEWLISYVYHILQGDARDRWNDAAYHASAFEMEAYAHEAEANYLSSRRWFAFVKYYGKL